MSNLSNLSLLKLVILQKFSNFKHSAKGVYILVERKL